MRRWGWLICTSCEGGIEVIVEKSGYFHRVSDGRGTVDYCGNRGVGNYRFFMCWNNLLGLCLDVMIALRWRFNLELAISFARSCCIDVIFVIFVEYVFDYMFCEGFEYG